MYYIAPALWFLISFITVNRIKGAKNFPVFLKLLIGILTIALVIVSIEILANRFPPIDVLFILLLPVVYSYLLARVFVWFRSRL